MTMMSDERIDHAAEARKLIAWGEEWMGEEGSTDATNLATALHTVTHATLALVEQQRIANLIALSVKQPIRGGGQVWISSYGHDGVLRPDISEALGLRE